MSHINVAYGTLRDCFAILFASSAQRVDFLAEYHAAKAEASVARAAITDDPECNQFVQEQAIIAHITISNLPRATSWFDSCAGSKRKPCFLRKLPFSGQTSESAGKQNTSPMHHERCLREPATIQGGGETARTAVSFPCAVASSLILRSFS